MLMASRLQWKLWLTMSDDIEEFVLNNIVGKRIVRIRPMSIEESRSENWKHNPNVMVIELANGVKLFPSQGLHESGNYHPLYGEYKGKCFTL